MRLRLFAVALLLAAPAAAGERPLSGDAATLADLMIQDVCLDGAGHVVVGASPVDGNPACAATRDLRPGEPLPYHKHDHPGPADRAAAPLGYQRHDSVPVDTAGFGRVVEHGFDFGVGEGRRFGVFDAGRGDGGDIVILSPGAAAIGATEDGSGFQLFAGACSGALTRAALTRSWLIATYDPARPSPLRGEATARLKDLRAGAQRNCPERLNAAFTVWHTADVRYRAAPGQGVPVTLPSLVSEHYGGGDPATADHVERFYFTRELGLTRWERWQNSRGNRQYDAAAVAAAAARFAATGRCSATPPPEGAAMVLVDCREWTRIVPPDASTGDPPGFFIAALRARGVPAAAWFAPRD